MIARDELGVEICARCGRRGLRLTKDHFIPRACGMNVDEAGNIVGLCERCNKDKGCMIVTPNWYRFLKEEQKKPLLRYMRYAKSWILANTDEEEVVQMVKKL